eukprot:COSAG01_NODE_3768_length_5718_cov_1.755473_3_plen_167_part_00
MHGERGRHRDCDMRSLLAQARASLALVLSQRVVVVVDAQEVELLDEVVLEGLGGVERQHLCLARDVEACDEAAGATFVACISAVAHGKLATGHRLLTRRVSVEIFASCVTILDTRALEHTTKISAIAQQGHARRDVLSTATVLRWFLPWVSRTADTVLEGRRTYLR